MKIMTKDNIIENFNELENLVFNNDEIVFVKDDNIHNMMVVLSVDKFEQLIK